MRGILDDSIIQRFRVANNLDSRLAKFFPSPSGEVVREVVRLSTQQTEDLLFDLWHILNGISNFEYSTLSKWGILPATVREYMWNRKKSSRFITEVLKKNGFDPDTIPALQFWFQRRANMFARVSYDYQVQWDISGFDLLGESTPCRDGGSCYRNGEAYMLAPIHIAAGFYAGALPTFCLWIRDKNGRIIARAWGAIQDDVLCFGNMYWADGVRYDKSVLLDALKMASNSSLALEEGNSTVLRGVHINEDFRHYTFGQSNYSPYSFILNYPYSSPPRCHSCWGDIHNNQSFPLCPTCEKT